MIRGILSSLVICAIAMLFGCDRKPSASQSATNAAVKSMSKIRLGISPFQDTLIPIIADKKYKNWYADEGLEVEIKVLGWTEVQEALASGAVDVAINNCSAIVSTHPKAPELVYVYAVNSFDDGFALIVRPHGSLRPLSELLNKHPTRAEAVAAAAAQLKGKTVVTTSNTDMEQGVAAAALRAGLDFRQDIKILDLNPEEGLAAFLAGSGDAYIGGVPQRTRAIKEGMIEMLTGRDLGPVPLNGFVSTKRFVSENEDAILRLLHVWFRVVKYVDKNPDDAGNIIVTELNSRSGGKFTIDDFKKIWNKVERFPLSPKEVEEQILSPTGPNYWKNRWDDSNHYFYEVVKRIPKPTPAEGVFVMPEVHEKYVNKYGKD